MGAEVWQQAKVWMSKSVITQAKPDLWSWLDTQPVPWRAGAAGSTPLFSLSISHLCLSHLVSMHRLHQLYNVIIFFFCIIFCLPEEWGWILFLPFFSFSRTFVLCRERRKGAAGKKTRGFGLQVSRVVESLFEQLEFWLSASQSRKMCCSSVTGTVSVCKCCSS